MIRAIQLRPVERREGVGANPPPQGIDPVVDAIAQAGTVGAVLDLLKAGGTPTAQQIAVAEAALNGIENDLLQVQLKGYVGSQGQKPSGASGSGVYVSAGATAAIALGAGLVGGVTGFLIGKRD